MIAVIVVVLIVLCLIIAWVAIHNSIMSLEVKVKEAGSDVEVALAKRYDILTQSFNVVKGYASHETNILTNLTQIRKGMTAGELQNAISEQDAAEKQLSMVCENYPQLYSNQIFGTLQNQIADTNEHLAAAKRCFNSATSAFNQCIVQFPANIVAGADHKVQKEFIKEDEVKKQDVNLDFSNVQ